MKGTALGLSLLVCALAVGACTRSVQPEDDSDPAIKARVDIALHGRKDIDIRYVSLDVVNGVVTISGIVPSPDQIDIIERIAKRTPGVDQVMDNLVVQE
ncbi:MAG TPA: BON domain-containing protein [Elusimicrobiota bacterium]|nr:BON domain-containing protein [Elusimicrobiota bacterium]